MTYTRAEAPTYSRKERLSLTADRLTPSSRLREVDTRANGDRIGTVMREVASTGKPVLVVLFMLTLLMPIRMQVGPLFLMPYRIFLLVMFVPLFFQLVSGKAGRMMIIDWLMFGSTLWISLALVMNHPLGQVIEPAGVEMIEFFGAYLLARVCIRSAEDFRKMVKALVIIVVVLMPFAVLEAVTKQPILMRLVPNSLPISYAGVRWGMRRAQVLFAHPIHYGAFVSTALGVGWFVLRPQAALPFRILIALVIGVSTLVSLSTGALVAFMAQSVLIAYDVIMKPVAKRWVIFGWAFVGFYFLANFMAEKSVFHTLVHKATFNSGSSYNRILIFDHGMKNVWANPIFGLGYNDWVRPGYVGSSMDNFWLVQAVRYGIPQFLMFAGAVGLIVYKSIKAPLNDPIDRACRVGFLVTMAGIIVAGGTVHYWKVLQAFVLFMIGSGVWMFAGGARLGDDDT